MTRTRQIAAVDSQMRDKMMQSPAYHNRPGTTAYPPNNGLCRQTKPALSAAHQQRPSSAHVQLRFYARILQQCPKCD